MNARIRVIVALSILSLAGTQVGRSGSLSVVTFRLTPYAPEVASIKDLSFLLVQRGNRNETITVHTAEWEIRDPLHHRRVARVPVHAYFSKDNGTIDARPPHPDGSRNDFDLDDLRHIGHLEAGDYRMALLINGVRASNVMAFKIKPDLDLAKAPVITLGMEEASPGKEVGSLVAWIVGPTPEDPKFTNEAISFAAISVDGVFLKEGPRAWTGPIGPFQSGKANVCVYDSEYRLKDIDLHKPHDFQIKAGDYVSAPVHLDLQNHDLGAEWDRATTALDALPVPERLLAGVVYNEQGDPAIGWEVRVRTNMGVEPYTERTDEKGEYAFSGIPPGEYSLGCSPIGRGTPSTQVEHINVTAGQTSTVNLTFKGTYAFSGKVLDPKGHGIKDIPVGATWKDKETGIECETQVDTKEDGSFELRGPFNTVTYVGLLNSMKNKPRPHYDAKPGAKDINFIMPAP